MLLTIESLQELNTKITNPVIDVKYQIPIWFDLTATFLFAITGSVKAINKGYDYIGLLTLAMVSSVGGGLLRDLLLDVGPPVALKDFRFLLAVMAGGIVAVLFYNHIHRIKRLINIVDALSLGIYAIVGAQKTIDVGLNVFAAIIIGFVNASFGGVIRDVLMNEEPQVFKPGLFYAAAAIAGLGVYMILVVGLNIESKLAAVICIIATTLIRLLSIKFRWKTTAFKNKIDKET